MYNIEIIEKDYEVEVVFENIKITFSNEDSDLNRKRANEFVLTLLKDTGRIGY